MMMGPGTPSLAAAEWQHHVNGFSSGLRTLATRTTVCYAGRPMGWNWRQSINLGPVRLNLSKSGLGCSFGMKGFRIGKDSKGRTYTASSIPGTGLYRRKYMMKNENLPGAHGSSPVGAPIAARAARLGLYVLGAVLVYLLVKFLL